MKISTRGRYSLRVMIDLATMYCEEYIPLKDIAIRQEISLKYLESIMKDLSKAGIVDSLHGKGGGYKLNRPPKDYSVGEILRVTEGDLAPVACLDKNAPTCARVNECKTIKMWKDLYSLINDFFNGKTLEDLVKNI